MGQAFVADCDSSGNRKANLQKLAVESSPCESSSESKPEQDALRKECCQNEGEAAVEIRIHATHRGNARSHHIPPGYDYPYNGAGMVWSPGGITPRARAMSPFARSSKPALQPVDPPHLLHMPASDHLWGLEGVVAPVDDFDVVRQSLQAALNARAGEEVIPFGRVGPRLLSHGSSEHFRDSVDHELEQRLAQQSADFAPAQFRGPAPTACDLPKGEESPSDEGGIAAPPPSAACPPKGLLEIGPDQFQGPMPSGQQCAPPRGVAIEDDDVPSDNEEGLVCAVPLPRQPEFFGNRPEKGVPEPYATIWELGTPSNYIEGPSRSRVLVPDQQQPQTNAESGGSPVHQSIAALVDYSCDEQTDAAMVDCPEHSNDLAALEPLAARCLLRPAPREDGIDTTEGWRQPWQDDANQDLTAEAAAETLLRGAQKSVVQEIASIGQAEDQRHVSQGIAEAKSSTKRYVASPAAAYGKTGRILPRVDEEEAREVGEEVALQESTPVIFGSVLEKVSPEEHITSFE
mmetsp:Transcript_30422/g.70044  ORF Transcript_30422/g.70044 Transcript_30422/m.70044 type:complete len:517 (+) Transcript_30422:136-1686(+)